MKDKIKFYICEHCGNIITKVNDSGVPVVCCGEKMKLLEAGTTDGSREKHVPFVEEKDGKLVVTIGEVEHPMTKDHYIEWIALVTDNTCNVHFLKPEEKPQASFELADSYVVYEYCNLHGLWKYEK